MIKKFIKRMHLAEQGIIFWEMEGIKIPFGRNLMNPPPGFSNRVHLWQQWFSTGVPWNPRNPWA
jgi:hypothetical protein